MVSVNGEFFVGFEDMVLNLLINVWIFLIIVIVFVGWWVWLKWFLKFVVWLFFVVVYFEVVWVFFLVMVFGDIFDVIKVWVDSCVVMVFLEFV